MMLDDTRARRLIVAAAIFGLALRLLFGLIYWVNQPLTHDEHEYLALARGLASGAGFVYDDANDSGTAQRFGRAPGYPLFLAALDAGRPVPTSAPARVKIAQAFVGAAIVWVIGLLALETGGARVGVVAASLAAIYPSLVWTPAYVLSETIFSFVALASALMLHSAMRDNPAADPAGQVDRSGFTRIVISGALLGVGALIRPA